MDATSEPSMACHEVPEAEPTVQEEEEGQVIGYFDLENSGLQLVEGDSTFYLPPEALGEHVLMSEDGKEGQPIIVVVEEGSEDAVVQALTRNAQAMMGDQTEFTMNQLENAITASLPEQFSGVETITTAGGQQLLILSKDASESIADQEGASNEESPTAVPESGLVCQEGPKESHPEHPAMAADSVQVELQPEPQELSDVNNSESLKAVSEEKAAGSPAASEENSESIPMSESKAEPQATAPAHSREKNVNSECSLVSESKTVPLTAALAHSHENTEGDMLCRSPALAHACSQQKNPALPDGESAHNTQDGLSSSMSANSGPSSNCPLSPAAVVCAEGVESETCLVAQEREHEVSVDGSTSEITRTPLTVSNKLDVCGINLAKEAGKDVDHSVQGKANEVVKASNDIPSLADQDIQDGEAKEGNLCTDQSASELSSIDATPTCLLESSSEKVAKMEPQRTEAASEKPLKKRLRPEISGKTAVQAASLESEFKTSKVPNESEKVPLEPQSTAGSGERHASSNTACPLHKETEHVVSIHVAKLSGRTTALARGKVHKLIPSKVREKATSNGDTTPIPNTEAHQVCSLPQETRDRASLHEQTNLEGKETRKHLTGTENSDQLPGECCSTRDRAVADTCPEKLSFQAHQPAASMVEGMMLSAGAQSSKVNVEDADGLANSATKPVPTTPDESSQISRSANVYELDEHAGKPTQPREDAAFIQQAGVSEKLETEEPECLHKNTEGNCLGTSPAPAQAATVDQQKPALLDREPVHDTKGEHIRTTCLEGSLQSEQNIEVLSNKTMAGDEASHKLTEKESLVQSSSDTTSHQMPKLEQEAAQNHAASNQTEDKSVNGATSVVSQDVAPDNNQEASRDTATANAFKNASQGPKQNASCTQGSSKLDSHEEKLQQESIDENSDLVHDVFKHDAAEGREVEHKEKAAEHRGQDDKLQEPQNQREKDVPVVNSQASNRNDGGRGAAVECDIVAAQPSCSWQHDARPSCSWAVDEYDAQPSCSWAGENLTVKEEYNAEDSGGKLLAALDLVPCHEASPGPSHVDKKPLLKTRKRRKQAQNECADVKEEISPSKKRWNLRLPTKPRKRLIIPDSDDEDFEAYGSDDNPSEAQKIKSEEAFDVLLDYFKKEQAQKAATEAKPVRKRNVKKTGCAPSKRRLTSSQSLGTKSGAVGADESSAKTSKAKSTAKSAPNESSAKKISKAKSTKRSAPDKGQPLSGASSFVAAEVRQVRKRHSEPAKALALKKSATDYDDIQMPRTDLLAGDIRIRCQRPSYVSAKLPPRYHCSKCDFISSRMQNIVWHHKQDCPYTKSLIGLDTKSSKSRNSAPT